ncbi:hypothetical protein ACYOEI_15865 [Singulisphaera rosea]
MTEDRGNRGQLGDPLDTRVGSLILLVHDLLGKLFEGDRGLADSVGLDRGHRARIVDEPTGDRRRLQRRVDDRVGEGGRIE